MTRCINYKWYSKDIHKVYSYSLRRNYISIQYKDIIEIYSYMWNYSALINNRITFLSKDLYFFLFTL